MQINQLHITPLISLTINPLHIYQSPIQYQDSHIMFQKQIIPIN